jgi:hypothetical protein
MGQVFQIIYYFSVNEHKLSEVENRSVFDDAKIVVGKMVKN